jgi:hypothetical protein
MLYYGGIRFPRASFLGYYENVASSLAKLPRQLILVAAESAVIRQRWDPRLTDPAFAGSVSPYRASSRRPERYYADAPIRFDL